MKLHIFLIAVLISIQIGCKKKEESKETEGLKEIPSILFMFRGDVQVLDKGNNTIPLEIKKTKLLSNYTVLTRDKSSLDILLFDGSIVRVFPNTKIQIGTLTVKDVSNSKITMASGRIFVKTNKLPKNRNVIVQTNTTVAGVRGTEFMVIQDEETVPGKILVSEGSIECGGINSETKYIVENGKKLDFENGGFVIQNMSSEEKSDIERESQSIASIIQDGRTEIQTILDGFKEEKLRIIEEIDKKIEENKELFDKQKNKDQEILKNQNQINQESIENMKTSAEKQKTEVENKTKQDIDRIQSGNQSEMDRIKGGMKK